MTMLESETQHGVSPKSMPALNILAVFSVSLLLSAFLLFLVQPMFTKMVLPKLGGSPVVWSTAMVFFQGMLLLGYAYAHFITVKLKTQFAFGLHGLVLLAAAFCLPFGVSSAFHQPPNEYQSFWILGLYAVSIGLPFFAIAAHAPLLQSWFSKTGHPHAEDPYFLYGSSNIGSFVALISYPIVVEPLMTLSGQTWLWTGGYALLGICVLACGAMTLGKPLGQYNAKEEEQVTNLIQSSSIQWKECAGWTALAFVPSALLVAVTAHITTDIASAPFLWVIPLALFLLTFVLTFRSKPLIEQNILWLLHIILAGAVFIFMIGSVNKVSVLIAHLGLFFVAAMACHGEMVRLRPKAERLTEFYLCMSLGGVLGGLFAALIAPNLFGTVAEYPILIVASLFAYTGVRNAVIALDRKIQIALSVIALCAVVAFVTGTTLENVPERLVSAFAVSIVLLALAFFKKPAQAMIVLALGAIVSQIVDPIGNVLENRRSFFGVNKVVETHDGALRVMMHGTTMHGLAIMKDDEGNVFNPPLSGAYYHEWSPFVSVLEAKRKVSSEPLSVGVAGLGAGIFSCYANANESWSFFEIDPDVVRIARDSKHFNFVNRCVPDAPIYLGDARITLENPSVPFFDLLYIDVFSSDAIPTHLMTVEALQVYKSKLKDGGIVAFHISNRHLELESVVAAIAKENGMKSWYTYHIPEGLPGQEYRYFAPVHMIVVAREDADVGSISVNNSEWKLVGPDQVTPWTDDYSNVISALLRPTRESMGE